MALGGATLATRTTSPDLDRRDRPLQHRARKTVDGLLDATAAILDDEGFPGVTTNKIAARAGSNVATLYKYFPNKYAMLRALAERNMERQREVIHAAVGDATDDRDAIDRGLDAFMDHYISEPGFAGLADAIRATPALRELETAGIPAIVQIVAARLAERGAAGTRKEIEAMARVIAESGAAVLMAAREAGPTERKRLLHELKRMIRVYMTDRIS